MQGRTGSGLGFRKILQAITRRVNQRGRLKQGAWGKSEWGSGWVRTRLDQGRAGESSWGWVRESLQEAEWMGYGAERPWEKEVSRTRPRALARGNTVELL